MFWFDKKNARAMFMDRRNRTYDIRTAGRNQRIEIRPDVVADFTAMPFPDGHFHLVVFDPPHIKQYAETGVLPTRYGILGDDWRDMLRGGFAECFRVLRPNGVLIFKWNECRIKVREVLELTPEQPLFGQRCGKSAQTHWVTFMKP